MHHVSPIKILRCLAITVIFGFISGCSNAYTVLNFEELGSGQIVNRTFSGALSDCEIDWDGKLIGNCPDTSNGQIIVVFKDRVYFHPETGLVNLVAFVKRKLTSSTSDEEFVRVFEELGFGCIESNRKPTCYYEGVYKFSYYYDLLYIFRRPLGNNPTHQRIKLEASMPNNNEVEIMDKSLSLHAWDSKSSAVNEK